MRILPEIGTIIHPINWDGQIQICHGVIGWGYGDWPYGHEPRWFTLLRKTGDGWIVPTTDWDVGEKLEGDVICLFRPGSNLPHPQTEYGNHIKIIGHHEKGAVYGEATTI